MRRWRVERFNLVRKRAYQIWEEQGRPDGLHADHWHDAELQVAENERNEGEDPVLGKPEMPLRVKVLQPPSCRKTKRWRPYPVAQTSARRHRSPARRRVNGDRPDYLLEIREITTVRFGE
jgi:hypothetical protein